MRGQGLHALEDADGGVNPRWRSAAGMPPSAAPRSIVMLSADLPHVTTADVARVCA